MLNSIHHFQYEPTQDGIRITGFTGPESITDVVVPAIINGQPITEIGDSAFYAHSWIFSVDLPWTLKVIGEQAFRDCFHLQRINIPEGVHIIEHAAFKMCSALGPLILPSTLVEVGDEVFLGCEKLNQVEFRSIQTRIHPNAFNFHPEMIFVCFKDSSAWRFTESLDYNQPIHRKQFTDTLYE